MLVDLQIQWEEVFFLKYQKREMKIHLVTKRSLEEVGFLKIFEALNIFSFHLKI